VGEVHAFDDSLALARRLARALGSAPPARVLVHHFPDGETLVRVGPAPRRALLVRTLDRPDAKLLELLLAADALRRRGARRLTLVAPYLPYMRQDRVFRAGEPVSQRVVGELLGRAFDQVLGVEAHLHRIARLAEVFPCDAHSLPAAPALASWLAKGRARPCLVGPDAESEAFLRGLAERTGLPWIVGHKQRLGDRRVRVSLPPLPAGTKRALLVDDMASSGGTIAGAAQSLLAAGAREVHALFIHPVMATDALNHMLAAGVRRLLTTNSIRAVLDPRVEVLSIAPLLARALTRLAG